MFSGIVEEKGSIKKLQTLNEVLSIEINCSEDFVKDISVGDSVSVDGVCIPHQQIHYPQQKCLLQNLHYNLFQ